MARTNTAALRPSTKGALEYSEREVVEAILHFFTQTYVAYEDCEFTSKPAIQIRTELAAKDSHEIQSCAFMYPVSLVTVMPTAQRATGRLIVIDLGERRAFYYHPFSAY